MVSVLSSPSLRAQRSTPASSNSLVYDVPAISPRRVLISRANRGNTSSNSGVADIQAFQRLARERWHDPRRQSSTEAAPASDPLRLPETSRRRACSEPLQVQVLRPPAATVRGTAAPRGERLPSSWPL